MVTQRDIMIARCVIKKRIEADGRVAETACRQIACARASEKIVIAVGVQEAAITGENCGYGSRQIEVAIEGDASGGEASGSIAFYNRACQVRVGCRISSVGAVGHI